MFYEKSLKKKIKFLNGNFLRKLQVFALVFLLFSITNCQKSPITQEIESQGTAPIEVHVITKFKALSTIEQRIAYDLLSTEAKSIIWKDHIQTFLSKSQLNDAQRNLIGELLSKLTPKAFEKGKLQSDLLLYLNNDWGKRDLLLVGKETINQISTIASLDALPQQPKSNGRVEANCNCTPDIFINDCSSISNTSCMPTQCVMMIDGCGWFGWEECDMTCQSTQR